MKVVILSVDSDIGAELSTLHAAVGDVVLGTSRHDERLSTAVTKLDIKDAASWTPPGQWADADLVYYLIAVNEQPDAANVMLVNAVWSVEVLRRLAHGVKQGCKIVVFTSEYGSIQRANNNTAVNYRMSKAALNMGVKCLSLGVKKLHWCLYHPGLVRTKLIKRPLNPAISLSKQEAAQQCMQAVSTWSGNFTWLSHNGIHLDW